MSEVDFADLCARYDELEWEEKRAAMDHLLLLPIPEDNDACSVHAEFCMKVTAEDATAHCEYFFALEKGEDVERPRYIMDFKAFLRAPPFLLYRDWRAGFDDAREQLAAETELSGPHDGW